MPPTESVIPNAVFTDPLRLRLQQNTLSTRLLRALLALIFLYSAVAHAIARSMGLLPKEPDCVAAVANPYADSEKRILSAPESLFKVMPFQNSIKSSLAYCFNASVP